MRRPGVKRLRVSGAQHAAHADGGPQHQRNPEPATGEVVDFCGMIDELIHDQRQEITEHDLHDGPHAGDGRAHSQAEHSSFGDGRIDHAPVAEFGVQPLGLLEDALGHAHVLADVERLGVTPEFPGDSLDHRRLQADLPFILLHFIQAPNSNRARDPAVRGNPTA